MYTLTRFTDYREPDTFACLLQSNLQNPKYRLIVFIYYEII